MQDPSVYHGLRQIHKGVKKFEGIYSINIPKYYVNRIKWIPL